MKEVTENLKDLYAELQFIRQKTKRIWEHFDNILERMSERIHKKITDEIKGDK